MECEVCFNNYDNDQNRPLVGTCGHTFCLQCSSRFEDYRCPTCRETRAFRNPKPNYAILKQLDGRQEVEETPVAVIPNRTSPNEMIIDIDALSTTDSLIEDVEMAVAMEQSRLEFDLELIRSQNSSAAVPPTSRVFTISQFPSPPPITEQRSVPVLTTPSETPHTPVSEPEEQCSFGDCLLCPLIPFYFLFVCIAVLIYGVFLLLSKVFSACKNSD